MPIGSHTKHEYDDDDFDDSQDQDQATHPHSRQQHQRNPNRSSTSRPSSSPHSPSSSRSSFSGLEADPTVALLRSDSIPLRNMIRTPTRKSSHSSKRIYPLSDDEEEPGHGQHGGSNVESPRLRGRRSFMSSRSRRSSMRRSRLVSSSYNGAQEPDADADASNANGADAAAVEGGEESEPAWLLSFDERRSAKENKSLAVSAELDAMGMGKYQWFIFFLCGLGFFIDLLWAQAFGLILVPLKNEPNGFGAGDSNIGTLTTAFNVGLTVGAFSWGIGVDVVGRKWSFYLTCLIAGIFGIATGAAPTFTGLRILVAFVGFGVGGNIPIDCTITLEFLPTGRHYLLALLSVFQPVGTLVASGLAYAFVPRFSCGGGNAELTAEQEAVCTKDENAGWRYTLYCIGAITLFVFFVRFLVFKFRESPSYLINRGHDEEALGVLYDIAKVNKMAKPRLNLEDFRDIEARCAEIESELAGEGVEGGRTSDLTHGTGADKPILGSGSRSDSDADKSSAAEALAADKAAAKGRGNGAGASGSAALPRVSSRPAPDEKAPEDETAWETVSRTLKEMGAQLRGMHILFRDRTMTRITILLWLTYMADFFGFTIAGTFLPQILADRGLQAGRSLSETYRDYVAIYAPGIAACLLSCALIEVPRVGRQWVMVISSALMGVSMFLYTVINTEAGSVGLNAMEYFFQSLFNAVLYAVVPEFYPSAVRGTAAGITSTLGRIAGIVAPLAGDSLYGRYTGDQQALGAKYTLYLGGGVTLLCPLALALLPYDTRGRRSY